MGRMLLALLGLAATVVAGVSLAQAIAEEAQNPSPGNARRVVRRAAELAVDLVTPSPGLPE